MHNVNAQRRRFAVRWSDELGYTPFSGDRRACLLRGAPFVVAKDEYWTERRVHALLSEIHVIGGVAEFVDNCLEDNVVEILSDVIDAYHAYVEKILGRCNLIDARTAMNRHSWHPIINLTCGSGALLQPAVDFRRSCQPYALHGR